MVCCSPDLLTASFFGDVFGTAGIAAVRVELKNDCCLMARSLCFGMALDAEAEELEFVRSLVCLACSLATAFRTLE